MLMFLLLIWYLQTWLMLEICWNEGCVWERTRSFGKGPGWLIRGEICEVTWVEWGMRGNIAWVWLSTCPLCFNIDGVDFTFFGKTVGAPKEISAELEAEVSSRCLDEEEESVASLGLVIETSIVNKMLSYHSLPLRVMDVLNHSLCYRGPCVPPEKS